MAAHTMTARYELVIPSGIWQELEGHLFPGDGDEHGAVIGITTTTSVRGVRLLGRTLRIARDGIDYVPGEHGYRMLTPSFVREAILDFSDDGLGYLAIHCHGGTNSVGFSPDDMESHERGYPALRDIADEHIVGGLVFARNAVAGDLWLPDGRRVELDSARIVGRPIRTLRPMPPPAAVADPSFDRQARIFGDRGQELLSRQKVAVVGAGGAGSLLVEYLARLGVGHVVVIDPERIETTNLPRVVGARRWDAHTLLTRAERPEWMRRLGRRFSAYKVHIAKRVARQANARINVDAVVGDVVDGATAHLLTDCEYIFLAADSMQARLVVNAVMHQYLIPGVQVGAKVQVDKTTGEVVDVFSVSRPIIPGFGCLWCNELISSAALQEEAVDAATRQRQKYVDEVTVAAPSVITLNAVAAAHAADDYLFSVTGLLQPDSSRHWLRFMPREAEVAFEGPRRDPDCRECGDGPRGRLGRGQTRGLPTRA
jgi:hypothetical protein